jgi:hypothetical protein
MHGFLVRGKVVPEHSSILQIRLGVPLLRMDEEGKQGRITNEEYRSIVKYPVQVSFISIKLNREATRVSSCIC